MHQAERDRIYSHLMNFERRLQAIESAQQTRTQEPQPDSDGWIPWNGGECPVDPETRIEGRIRGAPGGSFESLAGDVGWRHDGRGGDITHYRPAKQEAEWPQRGDEYYGINTRGEIFRAVWGRGGGSQANCRDFLGAYPTREQAENAAAKIKRIMEHLRSGEFVILDDPISIDKENISL